MSKAKNERGHARLAYSEKLNDFAAPTSHNHTMETKWLEDFVSLAETRSFSQSAKLRHVTQPAFSRRIQALEAWAGVDLVDRSSYPTRLTVAGQTLHSQAIDMLQTLQISRAMLRGHASHQGVVEFAVPHTLALTYFPGWISGLQQQFGEIKSRLTALNVHDAVLRLVEGGCDFLIAYHHPSQPLQLDPDRFDMVVLGEEVLAPFAKQGPAGHALFELPATARKSTPYLAYASGAYLGRVVDFLLNDIKTLVHLKRVYETDMAESLKAMAIEGQGVAFLPFSAVQKEVHEKKLVQVRLPKGPSLEVVMEIRAYREKPQSFHPSNEIADLLWRHLMGE
jgi:LysR family transcriptional regulator, hypochlorite-specific transcription factor HypT